MSTVIDGISQKSQVLPQLLDIIIGRYILLINFSKISSILAGSRIIIFGGKGEKGKVFRDLHALDPVTMTWY